MYDTYPHDFPDHSQGRSDLDRLTHLVLVDGRLVEVWSEPVTGTRWQEHADRFDRELHRPEPEPVVATHERALRWLDDVCGGRSGTTGRAAGCPPWRAEHLCMTMRGVKKAGARTITSAVRGQFRSNATTRAEAMALIHRNG
jgi:hypothetical protein